MIGTAITVAEKERRDLDIWIDCMDRAETDSDLCSLALRAFRYGCTNEAGGKLLASAFGGALPMATGIQRFPWWRCLAGVARGAIGSAGLFQPNEGGYPCITLPQFNLDGVCIDVMAVDTGFTAREGLAADAIDCLGLDPHLIDADDGQHVRLCRSAISWAAAGGAAFDEMNLRTDYPPLYLCGQGRTVLGPTHERVLLELPLIAEDEAHAQDILALQAAARRQRNARLPQGIKPFVLADNDS